MSVAVYAVGFLPFPNYWSMLLVQITVGIVIYVCLCRLFGAIAFIELWETGWNRIRTSRFRELRVQGFERDARSYKDLKV